MTRRVVISFLVVIAAALACSPLARTPEPADDPGAAVRVREARAERSARKDAARAQHASTGANEATAENDGPLEASLHVETGRDVRFRFAVVNAASKAVEVTHPDGQTYELAVYDAAGQLVWRWGAQRMFTQTVRNTNLAGGEVLDVVESWHPTGQGRFTVVATLRSTNHPLQRRANFTVGQQLVVR